MIKRFILPVVVLVGLVLVGCGDTDNGEYVGSQYIGSRDFPSPEQVGVVWDGGSTILFQWEDTVESYLEQTFEVDNRIAVLLASGEIHYTENFAGARLVGYEGNIDLVLVDGTTFLNIAGVIADPPDIVITQAYNDALELLQEGHRVMIVVLDGWGWHMRKYHAFHQPFLFRQPARKAHTVFPPFTPVAMSSIFTGQTPDVHGVHDRATRTMSAPDIFTAAYDLGFSSTRVQGGVNIVQTSVLSALIPNLGHVFDTDQGVFDAAIARIDDSDLMFIHFNSIDDISHTYGPYSPQVAEALAFIDSLVWDLADAWDGMMIITADHGQHYLGQEGRLGDHLWVSHEDIFVPYLIIDAN
ncbi:MAG: alkaline phosphatase family protein [Defluviitaleaceae bacterium]|nr:alkaline phosphatase family protein [Defluviitaleaceae bacterium]